MNVTLRFLLLVAFGLGWFPLGKVNAQSADSTPSPKDKNAYLTIVNACETSLPERWRASLDIKAGAEWPAKDLRIGESSNFCSLEVKEGNGVAVFLHDQPHSPLTSIPASFEPGGYYTLVLTGEIGSGASKITANLIKEYPLTGAPFQGTRLVIFNAVGSYPIELVIPGVINQTMAANSKVEKVVPAGTLPIEMWFPYKGGEKRKITAGLEAQSGASYTLVVYSSSERADRPALFRTNATARRLEFEAMKKEAAEPKASPASP